MHGLNIMKGFSTCQLDASIVASVHSITLALVKPDNETFLPVSWDLAIKDNLSSKIADHGGTCITCCHDHLHHYMPGGPAALPDFIFEMAFFTISIVIV